MTDKTPKITSAELKGLGAEFRETYIEAFDALEYMSPEERAIYDKKGMHGVTKYWYRKRFRRDLRNGFATMVSATIVAAIIVWAINHG